jgi:hypothetical protein
MNEEKIGKLKYWSRISIKGEVQSLKKKKKKNWPHNSELQTLE